MNPQTTPAKRNYYLYIVLLISFFFLPSGAAAQREHTVYFQNTAYELNIYRIYGKEPGKTLMLIGGIQGNEPGGFLSADLYADMSLKKGNLIVVPRANFYSIILNQRGPHGDMNRKFTSEDNSFSMEDKIVTILKKLISESDYLLNLHDGSGYYHPTYISKWRNPTRFGQSIIADFDSYKIPNTDKNISLGEAARKVIVEVNKHIVNDLYKFHFMNTRTSATDSAHVEQRKSATYYALTVHNIPAFGIETSKFLPSTDLKVWFHNLVINAFMEEFGIIPQTPGVELDSPVLKYLIVSINSETPIVVKKDETLNLVKGDTIHISHIESNYERGLSLDILGFGDINDYRKDIEISKKTMIIVRKDNHEFGEIPITISEKPISSQKRTPIITTPEKIEYFTIELNGRVLLLPEGGICEAVKGDIIKIIDIFPKIVKDCIVNFKGFVGNRITNTGEDRGYYIDTGEDLLKRYSAGKRGYNYQVVVTKDEKKIGKLDIRLAQPKMDYLVLKVNNKKHILLRPDESITLSSNDNILLEAVKTNLVNNSGIYMEINSQKIRVGETGTIGEISKTTRTEVRIKKGSNLLAKIFIDIPEQ